MTHPPPPSTTESPVRRVWTAWTSIWLSTLAASLGAVLVLGLLSARGAEEALVSALEDHTRGQVGAVAAALQGVPVEVVADLPGGHAQASVADQLQALEAAAELSAVALLGPEGAVLSASGAWLPGPADADLIAAAREEGVHIGPLYRDFHGDLYLTAYAPLPSHPGWVVGLEGSGETLGAVDVLASTQVAVGALVVLLAGLLGALLAGLVSRPLRLLEGQLGAALPGDPPSVVGVRGPREVQAVARAARTLLGAIQERDARIAVAHQRELDQLHRVAAEIAHEVRNPLHAMRLSAGQLVQLEDPAARARVSERLANQIRELDRIVVRLVDLTRPLAPEWQPVALGGLLGDLAVEVGLDLHVRGATEIILRSDPVLLAEILRNLMLNAKQAGATELGLRLSVGPEEVWMEISDDGSGVADAAVGALFEWFHTTRAQGSGLGLPLSRRIAEALGGSLVLIRTVPATFRLTLPQAERP